MKDLRTLFELVAGLIAGGCFAASSAFACGVEWSKPANHFDGVNEFGYVSYWDQIGEIELGDGLTFPLIIGFRSDRQQSSPYLGYGWLFPILDSHIVQRSENGFDMIQPDGYTVPFGRDRQNPTILNGAKGWKAEINGNTITAHASCGWTLSFVRGKIAGLKTPKSKIINIRRDSDGVATDIIEGTSALLTVERDAENNVIGLRLGDRFIGLERTHKPRIQSVQGRNLVSGIDWAVAKITLPDKRFKTFDYTAAANLQPAIRIGGTDTARRQIVWDSGTRIIRSDGQWKYDVKLATIAGHNAAIGRTNANGQKQFWHYDLAKGEERSDDANGDVTIRKWFTSGILNGKLRSIEQSNAISSLRFLTSLSYNEKGDLIRKISPSGSFSRRYSADGKTVETFDLNGSLLHRETYDEQKRLVERRHADGEVDTFVYRGDEALKSVALPDGRKVEIVIANGQVESFKTIAQKTIDYLQP